MLPEQLQPPPHLYKAAEVAPVTRRSANREGKHSVVQQPVCTAVHAEGHARRALSPYQLKKSVQLVIAFTEGTSYGIQPAESYILYALTAVMLGQEGERLRSIRESEKEVDW